MGNGNLKIAVATVDKNGVEDLVSAEFGHSKTFTIIEVEDKRIKNVEVIDNPAINVTHGKGPIVAKKLAEMGVNIVISGEIGPGASAILGELNIDKLIVKPNIKVLEALKLNNLIN